MRRVLRQYPYHSSALTLAALIAAALGMAGLDANSQSIATPGVPTVQQASAFGLPSETGFQPGASIGRHNTSGNAYGDAQSDLLVDADSGMKSFGSFDDSRWRPTGLSNQRQGAPANTQGRFGHSEDQSGFRPLELEPTDEFGRMGGSNLSGDNTRWSSDRAVSPTHSPSTFSSTGRNGAVRDTRGSFDGSPSTSATRLPPPPSHALQVDAPFANPAGNYPSNTGYAATPGSQARPGPPPFNNASVPARSFAPQNALTAQSRAPGTRLSPTNLNNPTGSDLNANVLARIEQSLPATARKALQKIRRSARHRRHALVGEAMIHQDALEDLFSVPRPDPEEIGETYAKLFDVERRLIELQIATDNQIKDLLDSVNGETPNTGRDAAPVPTKSTNQPAIKKPDQAIKRLSKTAPASSAELESADEQAEPGNEPAAAH